MAVGLGGGVIVGTGIVVGYGVGVGAGTKLMFCIGGACRFDSFK